MSKWSARVLAEWRGFPERPDPEARCSRVGDVLSRLLPKLGLADALDEAAVRQAWGEIVGPFIAAHTAPDRIRQRVLFVKVSQPTIRFELERNWKTQIVARLAGRFGRGRVREVRFVA